MQQRDNGDVLLSATDLVNFLGCLHSTFLDLKSFAVLLKPDDPSDGDELLRRKGQEHEANYLGQLISTGNDVAIIPPDSPIADRARLTSVAMNERRDVIYQAALLGDKWVGYADFLIKSPAPSTLGRHSYEPLDTKLARNCQVKHIIQLGLYSRLLASRQGKTPERSHVVLGDQRKESFLVSDFDSYVRHAMRRLEEFVASPPSDSYPEPCSHCSLCRWSSRCNEQWQNDNHLSLVANIQRTQTVKLERAGVATVSQLALLTDGASVPDLNPTVLQRLRAQASLQEHKRLTGDNKFELLDPEPNRGFSRLPKTDAGDLFFDMEGDPLYPQGLEYLFGVCFMRQGSLTFQSFWAHDHEEECSTFTQFMAFLQEHLAAYPSAYIYHYNHYETTALKRLACR